jgi:hypothetical protein
MAFVTRINYNRQLTQSSGTTASSSTATFSGDTHIQQNLWVGLTPYSLNATEASGHNDYSYTGNSGYTFIVQQANQSQTVPDRINSNIYDDGRVASYGASITAYSGLTSGHTVLAISQSPLPPPDISSATLSVTASSVQIATSSLIAAAATDLGIDTAGNVVRDTSSQRYKKDIEDLKFTNLDKLLKLQPKKFKWISNNSVDWGYIAEDVDALGLKEFVNYEAFGGDNPGRPESVRYKKLTILLIEYLKQYGSVKSPTTLKCECLKDEFIVLEKDGDFTLDSSKTHKYVIKSLATCKIFPDNGLIDKEWTSLEVLPESCVEFRYYEPLSSWMIVSSDGIKES